MNNDSQMTTRVENGKIIIEIPVDLLSFAEKNRPDSQYIVNDKNAMAEYVADNILDFGGDSETGITEFEMLLDKLFDEAYENAENWIEADGWDD